jgi:hypothetical protein
MNALYLMDGYTGMQSEHTTGKGANAKGCKENEKEK